MVSLGTDLHGSAEAAWQAKKHALFLGRKGTLPGHLTDIGRALCEAVLTEF
jgi:hypothetical protein